jgi:SAM-dependent methyltransferase
VTSQPKDLVRNGYDQIAERYACWQCGSAVKAKYLATVERRVRSGGRVLDLGCGTGAHVTGRLAETFRVVGVDSSARSIDIARLIVPEASFVVADIATVAFRPRAFDAVVAFFSLIHVPRGEHGHVMAAAREWLRPGGLLVTTMSAGPGGDGTGKFLGVDMYWSGWDSETNRGLVSDAGFSIVSAAEETEDEDGTPVTHLWIVGTRAEDSRAPAPEA